MQIFYPRTGAREPILGAVGELQLEVFKQRLETEYSVSIRVERKGFTQARWMVATSPNLLDMLPMVVTDEANRPVALFNSEFEVTYALDRYKDLALLQQPPTEEEG